ncbi:MAG: hypothetical protein ACRDQ4_16585, partial [Pseudonocardiaceae bacterium]
DTTCHFRHPNSDHDRGAALMGATTACGRDVARPRREAAPGWWGHGCAHHPSWWCAGGAMGSWWLTAYERRIDRRS